MSKSFRMTAFAVGVLLALFVLTAVFLRLFVDFNDYKLQLEAAASEAMGMEVRVLGRMDIGFLPGLSVILEDVHIRNREAEIVYAAEARLGIDLLPLFQGRLRIGKLELKRPGIFIERNSDGTFNIENPATDVGKSEAVVLPLISLSSGTLRYVDRQSGMAFETTQCNLDVRHLRVLRGERSDLMKNLSLSAEGVCTDIRTKDFAASDLKFSLSGENGVFRLEPVMLHVFGAQGLGSIHAELSGPTNLYTVSFFLPQFRVEEVFQPLSSEKVAEGSLDFTANLSMQGKTVNEMKQTLQGQIQLRGEHLVLLGRDLDAELSRFESSRNFNLVDVGAFFFAGPLGVVATKGYDFANIFRGSGGRSDILKLVSDWKVQRGVAQAQDVAMATKQNRIVLHGGLDFVNQRFDDMTMALVDAQGCATVQQKINGSFQKPLVEKPSIVKSLAGPVLQLLKEGAELLPGGKCKVIYTGSVASPK